MTKRLRTWEIVTHAQTLAAMTEGSEEHTAYLGIIGETCTDQDVKRVVSIEQGRRRRDAGIVDGRIVRSFGTSFSTDI
jgi:hypothetical protein